MGVFIPANAEDGSGVDVAKSWATTLTPAQLQNNVSTAGMRLQLHTVFDSESRPMGVVNFTSLSLSLYLSQSVTGNLVISVVNNPANPVFSTNNYPKDLARTTVATIVYAGVAGLHTTLLNLDVLYPIYKRSKWNGYLSLVLEWTGNGVLFMAMSEDTTPANRPTLTTVDLPEITGIEGHVKAQSRIDRCPRCGKLMPREKFTLDGYTKGLYVCPKCWDPEDPPTRPIPPDAPPIND